MKNRHVIYAAGLYLLALVVRIIYLNQIEAMPTFDWPAMDEKYHMHLVDLIRSADGMPDEPFFRAPLYPYFLAAIYALADQSMYWTRMIQIVIGSILPVIVLALGMRLFENRVAWTAAIITALYPTFIYYDASLLITFLMTVLTVLLLWQVYRTHDNPSAVNFIFSGLLLGIAGLARPNILLFGPFLLIWAWLELKPRLGLQRTIVRYLLMGVAAIVVIAPVTVRNYQTSGDFVLIAWQGGYNFYIGNHQGATGWAATAPGIDQTWEGGYREAIAIAEAAEGRELSRAEVSGYWWDRGFEEISSDIGGWIGLEVKKLRLFFQGFEIPNNQSLYMVNDYSSLMSVLMWNAGIKFPFGIIAPLALIGLAISLRQWRKYLPAYLLLGSYILSLLLFFVCARFRQPLVPILILFASLTIIQFVDYVRQRNYKTAAVIVAFLLLLGLESNHRLLKISDERLRAESHLMLGNAYLEENMVNAARGEFMRAVRADSTLARAYNNLGMLAARRGDMIQARKYFTDAFRQDPNSVPALSNLASIYLDTGNPQEAVRLLERARSVNAANPITHLKLAAAYTGVERLEDAYRSVIESLRLDPSNSQARELRQYLEDQLRAGSNN